jgi:hypothetical protein
MVSPPASLSTNRMLKKTASGVLASFKPSTYPRGYASGPSLAAALLDGLFEHPEAMLTLRSCMEGSGL